MSTLASERLLTTAEVASRAGVSLETVRRWQRAGLIRAIRVGARGRYRIPESELERIFAATVLADDEAAA